MFSVMFSMSLWCFPINLLFRFLISPYALCKVLILYQYPCDSVCVCVCVFVCYLAGRGCERFPPHVHSRGVCNGACTRCSPGWQRRSLLQHEGMCFHGKPKQEPGTRPQTYTLLSVKYDVQFDFTFHLRNERWGRFELCVCVHSISRLNVSST